MMEEQLKELSIFSLRELARRTGVSSPTSKKKQQLIDDIIAINNGVKKPHIPKTKQGRPPKMFGYDVSNIFDAKNQQAPSFAKDCSLKQDCEDYHFIGSENKDGVVEILSNNAGFLWINQLHNYDCYFIPASLVEKYSIKSGDKIVAKINFGENQTIVEDIILINNLPATKANKNRKDYFVSEHILDKNNFEFSNSKYDNLKIYKGENTYFYGKDNNLNTNYIIELLNSIKADNKIYINVSIVEKNKHILKSVNDAELYVSKITDDLETSRRIVALSVERALRLFEQDKNVVIVVDDALSVASIDNQELSILKRLMSITKNGESASISILAIMDEDKQINQIEKLADNKLKI